MSDQTVRGIKRGAERDQNDANPKKIKSVHLQVMSREEIIGVSTCEVTSGTLYEKNVPKEGSLNDTRLGTCDPKLACSTCRNNLIFCSGHSGHIILPEAVYHVAFIGQIVKLLRCICPNCSNLIILGNDLFLIRAQKLSIKNRFALMTNYLKSKKTCAHCSLIMPKITTEHGFVIKREWIGKGEAQFEDGPFSLTLQEPLTPGIVKNFLSLVKDEIYIHLGLNPTLSHPRDFVLDVLLVPPVIIRPSVVFSSSARQRAQVKKFLYVCEMRCLFPR
jgi:DNA-directed RNA polymerase beta' subunit